MKLTTFLKGFQISTYYIMYVLLYIIFFLYHHLWDHFEFLHIVLMTENRSVLKALVLFIVYSLKLILFLIYAILQRYKARPFCFQINTMFTIESQNEFIARHACLESWCKFVQLFDFRYFSISHLETRGPYRLKWWNTTTWFSWPSYANSTLGLWLHLQLRLDAIQVPCTEPYPL